MRDTRRLGERPDQADLRLTQRDPTALDYDRPLGGHENRAPALTKNRESQVRGD